MEVKKFEDRLTSLEWTVKLRLKFKGLFDDLISRDSSHRFICHQLYESEKTRIDGVVILGPKKYVRVERWDWKTYKFDKMWTLEQYMKEFNISNDVLERFCFELL